MINNEALTRLLLEPASVLLAQFRLGGLNFGFAYLYSLHHLFVKTWPH